MSEKESWIRRNEVWIMFILGIIAGIMLAYHPCQECAAESRVFSEFDFYCGCRSGCIEGLIDAWDTFNSTKDIMSPMGDRCFEYCNEMIEVIKQNIQRYG